MPMDYLFTTLILGLKIGTLVAGAMLFSGGSWARALGAGLKGGIAQTGYTAPTRTRLLTFWADVAALVVHDHHKVRDFCVRVERGDGRPCGHILPTTPSLMRRSISASSRPSSASTSSLCSPRRGAWRCRQAGVSERWPG